VALLTFTIVLMVVMLASAIMLIIRAVVLTFLIITSPIGFAGMVVPFMKSLSNDWWKNLINQSFFAPIYLLLMLISLKIMEGVVAASGTQSIAQALTASDNTLMGAVVMMLMIIAFLIAALIMSKKMGAYGADMAIGAAGKVAGFSTFGLAAGAGRFVGGGLGSMAARGIANSTFLANRFPKLQGHLYAGAKRAASSSWDARSAGIAGQSFGGALGKIPGGVGVGSVSSDAKGGHAGYASARTKAERGRVDAIHDELGHHGPSKDELHELNTLYKTISDDGAKILHERERLTAEIKGGPTPLRGKQLNEEVSRRMTLNPIFNDLIKKQTENKEEVQRIRASVDDHNKQRQSEHGEAVAKSSEGWGSKIAGGVGMVDLKALREFAGDVRKETTMTMDEQSMKKWARIMEDEHQARQSNTPHAHIPAPVATAAPAEHA
jgi:hypothetical protein